VIPFSFVDVASGPALFSELNDDTIHTHERLSIEVMNSIFGVLRALEFDETKARHDSAVNDTAIAIEKFCNIIRTRIRGESAEVKTSSHGG
jgi:hypothetical protein